MNEEEEENGSRLVSQEGGRDGVKTRLRILTSSKGDPEMLQINGEQACCICRFFENNNKNSFMSINEERFPVPWIASYQWA